MRRAVGGCQLAYRPHPCNLKQSLQSGAKHEDPCRKLNGFDILIADKPNSRVNIFRHPRLQPDQLDLIEQAPGTRCLIIGGHRTKHELRRALRDIGRIQLGQISGRNIGGKPHTALRAYLGLS